MLTKQSDPVAPAFFSADVANARRFYLNLNPPKRHRLAVVFGGIEYCKPDYVIHRDTFPFYSIEYVTRGSGEVRLNDHTFSLQPGRLFSYGPGVPHHIRGDSANPLVKYFVDFSGTNANSLLRSCDLLPGTVSEVFPATALQPLFDELIQVGLMTHRDGALLCGKILECLILRIAGARAPVDGAETRSFTTYQKAREYIERHCLRLRTLDQLAAECHVNNAHLCRLFRRFDHQSPYQYLLRLKMNYAAGRLRTPEALVKQVAEESGFSDPFHFSRVFTSVFGLSPSAFRRLR